MLGELDEKACFDLKIGLPLQKVLGRCRGAEQVAGRQGSVCAVTYVAIFQVRSQSDF